MAPQTALPQSGEDADSDNDLNANLKASLYAYKELAEASIDLYTAVQGANKVWIDYLKGHRQGEDEPELVFDPELFMI